MHKTPLTALAAAWMAFLPVVALAQETKETATPPEAPAASTETAPAPAPEGVVPEEDADEVYVSQDTTEPFRRHNLITNGGFEVPKVKGRKNAEDGATPANPKGTHDWIRFAHKTGTEGGKVTAGFTSEVAHTGKQSAFLKLEKVTAAVPFWELSSVLIPIRSSTPYHVGIWAKIDAKHPFTLDQHIPALRLQVEFYQSDKETQTGETVYKVQPIPGNRLHKAVFTTKGWTQYAVVLKSPADAAFAKVTWTVFAPPGKGSTSGTMYFDDVNMQGEPPLAEEPEMEESDAAPETDTDPKEEMTEPAGEAADPAAPAAAAPAPTATPVPAAKPKASAEATPAKKKGSK